MPAFLAAYPYLTGSLILIAASVLGYAACPAAHRRSMLLSGLLMAPFALCSVFIVPEYWRPTRVAVFLAGPEDLLFSAACGAMAWLFAIWPFRDRIFLRMERRTVILRYLPGTAAGVTVWCLFRLAGAAPMSAAALSAALLALFVLWRRGWTWRLALSGCAGFTLFYFALTKLVFTLFPHFVNEWNPEGVWGNRLLGVPLDEVGWAATSGAVWPLFAAWIFEARLEPEKRAEREGEFLS